MTKVTDRYLEERRQEILDAARRVFVEKGYAAATMNDIAAEAGVAAGSIYRYFPSKADLISAVVHGCVDEDMESWQAAPPPGATAGEAFLALGQTVREQRLRPDFRDTCILRLESYLAAGRDPDLRERVTETLDESIQGLSGYIRAAQESGELDATIDAQTMSRFLHAFAAGVGALSTVYGPSFSADQAWDLLIRFVGASISAEAFERMQSLLEAAAPRSPVQEGHQDV